MDTLIEALNALAADWRDRDYVGQYRRDGHDAMARDEGKNDAYREAADELLAVLERFAK